MIRFEGDRSLFDCGLQTLTCPVNTVGVMGAGLALAMRKRYRGLFDFYRDACHTGKLMIGTLLTYPIPNSEQQVLLFPTKEDWRNPSKVEYLERGLVALSGQYQELGIEELGLPPIGCGYGQLDYIKDLKPLVNKYLVSIDLPVELLLYRYN